MKNNIIKDLRTIIKAIEDHKHSANLQETRETLEEISRLADMQEMETGLDEQNIEDLKAIAYELMEIYKDHIRPNLHKK